MTTLSIIILSYNTKTLLLECLQSLYQQYKNELSEGLFEIIVVDNNSQDDSVQILKKTIKNNKWKYISLIENKENLGFGQGNNTGVTLAKGKYVLFLNSDTKILDNGIVDMVGYMESNSDIAILGGKLENPDGTVQPSAAVFYTLVPALVMLLGLERIGMIRESPRVIKKVDWVSGGFMLVRKSVFMSLGGFDKALFMYMEDMELCFRAGQKGHATYFYPGVKAMHKSQGSSNRSFAITNIYKGLLYFYRKNMPYWEYNVIRFVMRAKAQIFVILGRILHNKYLVTTYEKALTVS